MHLRPVVSVLRGEKSHSRSLVGTDGVDDIVEESGR